MQNQGDPRDTGSVPGLGRSPGGGNGNSLQYSCLGNPMDRGAWWATVHGVTKRVGHEFATEQQNKTKKQSIHLHKTLFRKHVRQHWRAKFLRRRWNFTVKTTPGISSLRSQGCIMAGWLNSPRSGAGAGRSCCGWLAKYLHPCLLLPSPGDWLIFTQLQASSY